MNLSSLSSCASSSTGTAIVLLVRRDVRRRVRRLRSPRRGALRRRAGHVGPRAVAGVVRCADPVVVRRVRRPPRVAAGGVGPEVRKRPRRCAGIRVETPGKRGEMEDDASTKGLFYNSLGASRLRLRRSPAPAPCEPSSSQRRADHPPCSHCPQALLTISIAKLYHALSAGASITFRAFPNRTAGGERFWRGGSRPPPAQTQGFPVPRNHSPTQVHAAEATTGGGGASSRTFSVPNLLGHNSRWLNQFRPHRCGSGASADDAFARTVQARPAGGASGCQPPQACGSTAHGIGGARRGEAPTRFRRRRSSAPEPPSWRQSERRSGACDPSGGGSPAVARRTS